MSIETLLPNWTLIPQILIFWATLFVLHRYVFKPFGAIIQQRINETDGLRKEAERLRAEATELQSRYEGGLDKTRAELHKILTEKKRAFDLHANEIIAKAKTESNEMNEKVKKELGEKSKDIQRTLEKQLEVFSQDICEKVLGRRVSS